MEEADESLGRVPLLLILSLELYLQMKKNDGKQENRCKVNTGSCHNFPMFICVVASFTKVLQPFFFFAKQFQQEDLWQFQPCFGTGTSKIDPCFSANALETLPTNSEKMFLTLQNA